MIWLFALALAAWTVRLSLDLSHQRAVTRALAGRLAALEGEARPEPRPQRPRERLQPEPAPAPVPQAPGSSGPIREPAAGLAERAASPPAAARRPPVDLVRLLSEKGLAWMGGGALVLGGLFLVGYAAQRGLFTPPVRLVSAVLGALAMLGVSEWLRRPGPSRNSLAAAILAGAGASGLYATVWAAWGLYNFLPGGPAVVLMTAVSLLLLGLSLRHRQPLALLALLGAFTAPEIAGRGLWSEGALTFHLLLVVVAGFAVASVQRWSWTALATVLGVAGVSLIDAAAGAIGPVREASLNLATPALALAFAGLNAYRAPRRPFALVAPLALGLSALCLTLFWVGHATMWPIPAALAVLALLAGLGAGLGTGRGWSRWEALIAPAVLTVLGLVLVLSGAAPAEVTGLRIAGAALAGAWILSGLLGGGQARAAPVAATGALALMLRAALDLDPLPAALALEAGAAALFLAAALRARRRTDRSEDLALGAWSLAGGLALAAAVRLGALAQAVPALEAALALGLVLAQRRLGWRGLTVAAMAAGGAAIAGALDPRFFAPAVETGPAAGLAVLVCAIGGVLLAFAGRLPRLPEGQSAPRQSLTAAAVILGLIGAFIGLRWCASGQGVGLSLLLESSLRSLLLALAGAALLLAVRDRQAIIGRVGPHLLLALAALHATLCQLLLWNPWWGLWANPVEATPLVNSLALAYLAPAGAFALAAARSRDRAPAQGYGVLAALYGLVWALMELRHAFHGPDLTAGISPYAERLAQAALLPLLALILDRTVRQGVQVIQAVRWVGLVLALTISGLIACPWWAADPAPLGGLGLGLLAGALLVALAALTWISGRIERARAPILGETALVLAAGQALLLATLAVRWAFHPADLAQGPGQPLETWAYSAVWAVVGAGLLALGSGLRERSLRWTGLLALLATGGKVALFDTANLEGVVRAGSFLAVGVLMVAAAVASRRLTAGRATDET